MPAGIYTIVRGGDVNPVQVTRTTAIATSRQPQAHLLYVECEHRFAKWGEDWTIRSCWHSPIHFPLREGLLASTPVAENPDVKVYLAKQVPHLKIEDVAYFGASIFWRAAVRRWGTDPGDYIDLGEHQEPLRRFLFDRQRFPDRMVLIAMLSASNDEQTNRSMALPWPAEAPPCHKFKFVIPGISFFLMVGDQIPPECMRTCTAHTGMITICSWADAERVSTAVEMVNKAEVKGKLKLHPRWN